MDVVRRKNSVDNGQPKSFLRRKTRHLIIHLRCNTVTCEEFIANLQRHHTLADYAVKQTTTNTGEKMIVAYVIMCIAKKIQTVLNQSFSTFDVKPTFRRVEFPQRFAHLVATTLCKEEEVDHYVKEDGEINRWLNNPMGNEYLEKKKIVAEAKSFVAAGGCETVLEARKLFPTVSKFQMKRIFREHVETLFYKNSRDISHTIIEHDYN